MRNYLGFVLGIVVGCAGLLAAQLFLKSADDGGDVSVVTVKKPRLGRETQQLVDARERIETLEAQLTAVSAGDLITVAEADQKQPEDGKKKAASFLEMMMSFGDNEAQRKIDKEVARLAGELGLSENQQSVLREALLKKMEDGKSAGLRLMTGQASIADLLAADEHNFTTVDNAIGAVLDSEQLVAYEAQQEAREVKRIQVKTEEELGELTKAAELTDEQQEAAWEILADINSGERPGQLPEDTTADEFTGILDQAIANRVNGLAPILNEEQREVYHGQTEDFRKMVTTLIGHATGSEGE